jgi:hypothetical protein
VTFPFQDLVVGNERERVSRPTVSLVIDGIDRAPQTFLIDSGAGAIRLAAELAELFGVDLAGVPAEPLAIGGAFVDMRPAVVRLALPLDDHVAEWETTVWFCDPWPRSFGILGLQGFLECFDVHLRAADGEFDVVSRLSG